MYILSNIVAEVVVGDEVVVKVTLVVAMVNWAVVVDVKPLMELTFP